MNFLKFTLLLALTFTLPSFAIPLDRVKIDSRMSPNYTVPFRFRHYHSQYIYPYFSSNKIIIGSAQPHIKNIEWVTHHVSLKNIYLINLRFEPYYYYNTTVLSPRLHRETERYETIEQQGEWIEALYPLLLQRHRNYKKTVFEMSKIFPFNTEAEIALALNIAYQPFPVHDHQRPRDEIIDAFVTFIRKLPQEQTALYFHCRAGKGRTTTFMTMVSMLENAKYTPFDILVDEQRRIGGIDLSLSNALRTKRSKRSYAIERAQFLQAFYRYVRENDDNFVTSWSEWRKRNSLIY